MEALHGTAPFPPLHTHDWLEEACFDKTELTPNFTRLHKRHATNRLGISNIFQTNIFKNKSFCVDLQTVFCWRQCTEKMLLEEHPLPKGKDTNPHHHRQGFLEARPQSRVQGVDPQLWQTAVAGHAHKPTKPLIIAPEHGSLEQVDPGAGIHPYLGGNPRTGEKSKNQVIVHPLWAQTKDRSNSSSLELLSLLQKKTKRLSFSWQEKRHSHGHLWAQPSWVLPLEKPSNWLNSNLQEEPLQAESSSPHHLFLAEPWVFIFAYEIQKKTLRPDKILQSYCLAKTDHVTHKSCTIERLWATTSNMC